MHKLYTAMVAGLVLFGTVSCGKKKEGQDTVTQDTPVQQKTTPADTVSQAGATTATEPSPENAAYTVNGEKVYKENCLVCHQANGSGVPGMNPPLQKTDYVLGDRQRLISIVLKGSNVGLNINGQIYSNAMPPHKFLSDTDIADVLSYIRNTFGNKAAPVTADEVKPIRAAIQ